LLHNNSNTIPKDFSVLVILAGMALVHARNRLLHRREDVQPARSAWIIAIIVTVGMYFAGKFPTYYGWMLGFPLAVILASYFENATGRIEVKVIASIAVLACGVGLPLQAALASHDWKERNPAAITAWLGPKISTNDVVYCDYPFYFIARKRARQVFAGHYFNRLTREDLNRITMVIVGENGSEWKQSKGVLTNKLVIGNWRPSRSGVLGNNWEYGILSAPNYGCTVYKLSEPVKP